MKANHTRTTGAAEAAFLEGCDLAVAMLKEAEAVEAEGAAADRASIEAQYRDGSGQADIARPFLEVLVERPQLIAGFAAVLTDRLVFSCACDPEKYERLTVGQMLGPRTDPAFVRLLVAMVRPAHNAS